MLQNERWTQDSRPKRRGLKQLAILSARVRGGAHVRARAGECRSEQSQPRHWHASPKQPQHPFSVAHVAKARVEFEAALEKDASAKKHPAAKRG